MKKIILCILIIFIVGCNAPMKELSCCTKCIENWDDSNRENCIDLDYVDYELSNFCRNFFEENNANEEFCRKRWSEAK